ncbi:prefoldin subunit alpha [archaeon]|nr:prefoldin subunit alpha [archaeon]
MGNKESEDASLKMQVLAQEAKEIQQQISLLSAQYRELFSLLEAIDSIKDKKADFQLLTSLGAGVFFKTKIEDCKNLLINVGAETVIEEDIECVKSRVSNQLMEIESVLHEFEARLQNRVEHMQKLHSMFSKE